MGVRIYPQATSKPPPHGPFIKLNRIGQSFSLFEMLNSASNLIFRMLIYFL